LNSYQENLFQIPFWNLKFEVKSYRVEVWVCVCVCVSKKKFLFKGHNFLTSDV
jgi:hypothetical protein